MSLQTVTIQLPERIYSDVAKRARRMHRSVEEEVVAVVSEALPTINDLPSELTEELEQLALLSDAELWQAARTKLGEEEAAQMQTLVWKQQRDGLTKREQSKAENLLQRYNRTMLVRAKAAVLLKERGFDISSLNLAPAQ